MWVIRVSIKIHNMDLCSELCSSGGSFGRPSCMAKTLIFDIARTLFNQFFFHTGNMYRHFGLLQFYTTFTDLDLAWVSQSQWKSKTYRLHFLAHFSCDQEEIWCGDEALQVEHHKITFGVKVTADCVKKPNPFNVGMHLNVCELICFKLVWW